VISIALLLREAALSVWISGSTITTSDRKPYRKLDSNERANKRMP